MTLKARNRILLFSFFFTIIPFSLYNYTLFSFLQLSRSFFRYLHIPGLYQNLLIDIVINGVFFSLCFFAALIIFWNFRKTISIEIFFIIAFLLSCTLFSLRPLLLLLIIQKASENYLVLISKIIFFAHLLSLSLLFFSGFYKIGFKTTKSEWSFMAAILISFMLTTLFPIDTAYFIEKVYSSSGEIPSIFVGNVTNQPQFSFFLTLFFSIISVTNYFVIWFHNREKRYLYLAIIFIFITISFSLLLFQTFWIVQSIALFVFIISIFLFSKQVHQLYRWI